MNEKACIASGSIKSFARRWRQLFYWHDCLSFFSLNLTLFFVVHLFLARIYHINPMLTDIPLLLFISILFYVLDPFQVMAMVTRYSKCCQSDIKYMIFINNNNNNNNNDNNNNNNFFFFIGMVTTKITASLTCTVQWHKERTIIFILWLFVHYEKWRVPTFLGAFQDQKGATLPTRDVKQR